jgi:hypothetical protein
MNEPIPDAKVGREKKFPELEMLEPGTAAKFDIRDADKVRHAASYITRTTGRRFVTRSVEEEDEEGESRKVFKVWRVEP